MKIQKYYYEDSSYVNEVSNLIRTKELLIWSPVYIPFPEGIRPYEMCLTQDASLLIQCPL